MLFKAVCSERDMTASTQSCLIGRGEESWESREGVR